MGENLQSNYLSLDELIGQESVKQRLALIAITFGHADSTAMPGHMIFDGPAGSGRLAFAQAFATSIQAYSFVVDARSLETVGDVAALLTNFKERIVLLLESAEYLKPLPLARLTEAFQTGKLTTTIGLGSAARHHVFDLHPFTAILLPTNGSSRIPEGIRNAATFKFNFQHYSVNELERICLRHAVRLGLTLTMDETETICNASSGIVGNLVKRLRDIKSFMEASNGSASVDHSLNALGIIRHGNVVDVDLQKLSGIEFEKQICGLLNLMGFQTEMTSTSGDGGIDIVAHLNQPIVGGRYLFQCKRFAAGNVVGAPQLRDFFGALKADPTAIKGIFVTTSSFTEQARQFAQQVGIELIDGVALSDLLAKKRP